MLTRVRGFDYDFGTLNETGRTNELADSFDRAFRTDLTPLEEIRFMLSSYSRIVRVLAVCDIHHLQMCVLRCCTAWRTCPGEL